MTLQDLIRRFRVLADDRTEPLFWQNEDVVDWLNDAQRQACIRGRLLREDEDSSICEIPLDADTHTYPLHASVYELIHLQITPASGKPRRISLVTREWLDGRMPEWRELDEPACYAIQNETSIRIVGKITDGDTLNLECYRLPLVLRDDNDEPEIHAAHHEALIHWALHRAFSVPDAEKFDPQRSQNSEEEFTRYFGLLPDSDLRRSTRDDFPQHNCAVMP